ncbi:hypothetical protein EDC94DRAFT_79844 [Helicostylum pulchrum]|nr:hypothetical protein EDC94DRAFT_79844 [Helicostylum pulchrum]
MVYETKSYGLKVNKSKCVSNVDQDMKEFPWLGYLLNTENLDVYLDIGTPKDIKSSVITRFAQNSGDKLCTDCMMSIKSQHSDILFDSRFNSRKAINRNLYNNFYVAALRIETQVAATSKGTNDDFLFRKSYLFLYTFYYV